MYRCLSFSHSRKETSLDMGSSSITTNAAYALCLWVDGSGAGSPPAPWKTVFYPVKTRDNPNFAVVLQNSENTQQYALVIQGTTNIWDAILDFKINDPVSFPSISGAQIANGASQGMANVLGLKDGAGQTMNQFLGSIDWSASSLFLGGHSLGGTLASLMAPWASVSLFGQKQPLAQLPPGIQAITFAPFAAGNQQFADFLNSQSNYQANFNENDAVPHVWATAGQYSVPNMYALFPAPGPSPMPQDMQKQVQDKLNGIPTGFSYVQTTGISFAFPSEATSSWTAELSYQHNQAYDVQFGAGGGTTAKNLRVSTAKT